MTIYDPADWFWIVGGDQSRLFSSKAGSYVASDDASLKAWLADGSVATAIDTEANLISVLREANIPPYHRVRKSTIIGRLTDAELAQALSLLTVRQQERWRAPDQPMVNADDPETLLVLQAVGAVASVVMAPENPSL